MDNLFKNFLQKKQMTLDERITYLVKPSISSPDEVFGDHDYEENYLSDIIGSAAKYFI